MAKRKSYEDPFEELREWQQHQFTPYYFHYRKPLGFPPNPTKGMWRLAIINLILTVFTFLLLALRSWKTRELAMILDVFVYAVVTLLIVLRVKRFKPVEDRKAITKKSKHEERKL